MRGKKAKELRKLAEEITVGQPLVDYDVAFHKRGFNPIGDRLQDIVKHESKVHPPELFLNRQQPIILTLSRVSMKKKCTRRFYKFMKKQYMVAQRAGAHA